MYDVRYAVSSGSQIAFTVLDDGGHEPDGRPDIVVVAGAFFSFEMLLEDRVSRRFLDGLASLGRVVLFDKRGVGASDPITDWERNAQAQWAADLIAVVEAAQLDRPVLLSWETFGVGRLAASLRPDLFRSMILLDPTPSATEFLRFLGDGSPGSRVSSIEHVAFPSRIDDPDFQQWLARAGRVGASPSMASRMWDLVLGFRGPMTPEGIDVDTLVLHRPDSMHSTSGVREVASLIETAEFVVVPGRDAYPISGNVDPLLIEIARFVSGDERMPTPDHRIGVILFTDLVGSTDRAAREGDERWRALLDHHEVNMQRAVEQHGGRIIKFTGDGMLAEMPSATIALRTAEHLRRALRASELQLRVGIHVGDIDVRGDDISGMSVNIAARIMSRADADDILVSASVREAVIGTPSRFEALEPVELKGVPGTWMLHRYVPATKSSA